MTAHPGTGDAARKPGAHGHRDVAYEAAAPNAYQWTEIAYDYLLARKLTAEIRGSGGISTAVVTGNCPHCDDDVNFSEVLDAVSGESLATLGWRDTRPPPAGDGYLPLTVSCACTAPHSGRPADVHYGCGINFRIEIRLES